MTSDVSLVMSPVTACISTFPSLVSYCPELETTLVKQPVSCTEENEVSHKCVSDKGPITVHYSSSCCKLQCFPPKLAGAEEPLANLFWNSVQKTWTQSEKPKGYQLMNLPNTAHEENQHVWNIYLPLFYELAK